VEILRSRQGRHRGGRLRPGHRGAAQRKPGAQAGRKPDCAGRSLRRVPEYCRYYRARDRTAAGDHSGCNAGAGRRRADTVPHRKRIYTGPSLRRSNMFRRIAVAAALSIALSASALAADGKTHRIAIQVDQNDPTVMNMVLNNATNVIEHYRAK